MRVKARFKSVRQEEVGEEIVVRLREIYPDGRRPDFHYCADIYVDDPRFDGLREVLGCAGLHPWASEDGGPRRKGIDYSFEFEREYDPSDFVDCRFLEFVPRYIDKLYAGTSDDGTIELNRGVLRSKESFLRHGDLFASDRAKRLLEAEKFIGLSFKPTRLRQRTRRGVGDEEDELGAEISWQDFGPPWWQMICERVMPPLSPTMTLIADGRTPQIVHPPVDPNKGHTAKEGLYTPVELHYRASDLAQAEPYDYARNLERIGRVAIIVSKRFYDFCQAHELQADWVPVRVDPD